jgi:hypothetical protein
VSSGALGGTSDSVLADLSDVSALFAQVREAQVAASVHVNQSLLSVSTVGCPILPHSISHGMVLGRLAHALQGRRVSRSLLARYNRRFRVLSCVPVLAVSAVPRVPRHLGDVYRDRNSDGWWSAMRAGLHNFNTLKVLRLVDRPIDKNVMSCKWVFDIKYDATGA